jgi:hypothetical protein
MNELLSYELADFLLFSKQTYFRQFALIHEEFPFLPVLLSAVAVAVTIFAKQRGTLLRLALLWAACGWLFLHRHYGEINWAANWFALGFGVQAALLVAIMIRNPPRHPSPAQTAALAVALIYPLQAVIFGRPWQEAEAVGLSPDATAIFTLFMLATVAPPARWILASIPLLWCAIGLLTLWTMGAPEFWTLAAMLIAALIALSVRPGRRSRSGPAPEG